MCNVLHDVRQKSQMQLCAVILSNQIADLMCYLPRISVRPQLFERDINTLPKQSGHWRDRTADLGVISTTL